MHSTSSRKPQIWHNEDEDSESPCLLRPAPAEPSMVTQQSLGPLHLEHVRPPVDRVLSRMSGVTLLENEASMRTPEPHQPQLRVQQIIIDDDDEDSSASSTPAPLTPPSPPAVPRRSNRLDMLLDTVLASEDDDENRPYTPNVGDIPLNCMTQERVYHPRKRPAPSPASGMRGYQNGVQYSWKRHTSHMENDNVKRSLEGMESISIQTSDSTPSPTPSETSSSDLKPELMDLSISRKGDETTGTLIVYQPTCLDHHNDTHQENRQRLTTLCGPEGVLHKDRFKDLKWADLTQLRPARLNDLLRVHTFEYIGHLEKVVSALPEQVEDYSVGCLFDNKNVRGLLAHSDWIQVGLQTASVLAPGPHARWLTDRQGAKGLRCGEPAVLRQSGHGLADLQEQLHGCTSSCWCCMPRHRQSADPRDKVSEPPCAMLIIWMRKPASSFLCAHFTNTMLVCEYACTGMHS